MARPLLGVDQAGTEQYRPFGFARHLGGVWDHVAIAKAIRLSSGYKNYSCAFKILKNYPSPLDVRNFTPDSVLLCDACSVSMSVLLP